MYRYDFLLRQQDVPGIGSNLYILGTSEDGPVMEPIRVKSKEQAELIFGSFGKGTLVRAYEQAYDINSEIAIYLMRITGKSATLDIVGFQGVEPVTLLKLRTINGGSQYNNINVTFDYRADTGEVLMAFNLHSGRRIVYDLQSHMNLGHLVKHINDDAREGLHSIMASTNYFDVDPHELMTYYAEPMYFSGGEDGTDVTKDDLYIALDQALNLLVGREIDVITIPGMYVDDVHPTSIYGEAVYGSSLYASDDDHLHLVDTYDNNKVVSYHERLIDFCREQMKLGYISHGVIGLRPLETVPDTIEYDDSYIVRLVEATIFRDRYGLMEYRNGQWIDKGCYISIVGMEPMHRVGTPEEYFDNGAVVYAALLTGRFDTTTNVKVPIEGLRYELSDSTIAQLSKLGVVTFRYSPRHGYVVSSGVTAGHWETELHSVANMRMVQLTIAHMNDVVQKIYEADVDPAIRRTFIDDRVKSRLEMLKREGILIDYEHEIFYNENQDYGMISLILHTKYTVEGVATSASISYTGV